MSTTKKRKGSSGIANVSPKRTRAYIRRIQSLEQNDSIIEDPSQSQALNSESSALTDGSNNDPVPVPEEEPLDKEITSTASGQQLPVQVAAVETFSSTVSQYPELNPSSEIPKFVILHCQKEIVLYQPVARAAIENGPFDPSMFTQPTLGVLAKEFWKTLKSNIQTYIHK
ncbi:uncharacterized protein LOC117896026 [Drosophila subobscura]|uniref:uncharacterized protein LOC117896026 n=1 Tax=Drosophila subobscura TaxID=7241 RepID=UPI00155AEACA|nr:uncharacterized protein LOC117896026 [Drosophila subobscura]